MALQMPEPLPGQRRFQVCERCWYARHGGAGRQPERMQGAIRRFDITPCAICTHDTDSGHYMPLYAREVHAKVPVVFLDGPREGDQGITVSMAAMLHDTFDAGDPEAAPPVPPTSVRYALELIGGTQYARVAAIQREDVLHGDGIVRS